MNEEQVKDVLVKLDEIKRDVCITSYNFDTLRDAETYYHFDLTKLDNWLQNELEESKRAMDNAYRILGYVEEIIKEINNTVK